MDNPNIAQFNTVNHYSSPSPDFLARRVARYYQERVRDTWDGEHLLRGKQPGKDTIHLSSNDYLFLAGHPRIAQAQSDVLLNGGNDKLLSAVFLLNEENSYHQFEQRLASFMGAENGILCQSGWCANIGLLQSIADEQTPVYLDRFAHMSLWEGARSAGAQAVAFHHNDPRHLERQILKHGPGVVAVDSVYSTNGSVCPLADIAAVGNAHGCAVVVDESHSLGAYGARGEGLVASLGLTGQVHFRTASLAKAFAGRAGFITCPTPFYEYFVCESRPFIFSSALLPHEVARLNETLTLIEQDSWRRDALHAHADYLRVHLAAMGYNVADSQSQIIALESGSERQTMVLRDALEARGIFGAVFFAPATPKNRALIRFSVTAGLSTADLQRIVDACHAIRREVGLADWPSTRRMRRIGREVYPPLGAAAG
ncbi:MAG TPA: quorum-sensing autoinducer synthase [Betaproteobacteria bacterium]|nr:quorum-sensing autoinducer synthase [Betaproteobacteria bacterium]